ncbi:MAG: hypothetical protein PVG12_12235 [Gammaproteobacteria bacterium]
MRQGVINQLLRYASDFFAIMRITDVVQDVHVLDDAMVLLVDNRYMGILFRTPFNMLHEPLQNNFQVEKSVAEQG